ncbi:MAG: 30S ribosomal protein S20 [Phycisphaerae bacterium]
MPRSISSQKRQRQSVRRATRNTARRSQMKTQIRKVQDVLTSKDVDAADKALREAFKVIDRNANRGVLHRNTAARRKSQLTRRLNALKAAK